MLKLYNTLSRKKELFKPLKDKQAGLYCCGPTVYWYAHLGNLRTYIFEDVLRRTLEYNGFKVKHVMNYTDVGHLTSEDDTGEDKMEKGAKREGKTAWEIARFYIKAFEKDSRALNILKPDITPRATDHIKEQIELIEILEGKGFTYRISDGIYFNTSKLKIYGKLSRLDIKGLKAGARIKMAEGKKNPTDFALWKFSPSRVKRQMEWNSPWGKGFPGWHIECSAMSRKYLGPQFDIHCGGIDHIPIHHTNEIAQSETAFGIIPAKFWLHSEYMHLKGEKMAKSEGNIITLDSIVQKGYNPLAFRLYVLTAHYRAKAYFTFKGLDAAQNALNSIYRFFSEYPEGGKISKEYQSQFQKAINDDLNTPKALALLWKFNKIAYISGADKKQTMLDLDKVLGLGLKNIKKLEVPQTVKNLLELREKFRKEKNWQSADEIRKKIEKMGYWRIEDTKEGSKIKKI